MIIYNLTCELNHQFEGWFSSVSNFEKQQADKLITCPVCGNPYLKKSPAASHSVTASSNSEQPKEILAVARDRFTSQEIFSQLIEYVINHKDDAEQTFPDKLFLANHPEFTIHYIQEISTVENMQDLLEEGVEILSLTLKPSGKLH